ncbi:response regulator transcription factor [Pseudarthrobacter enclensis]|uniref:DNA-binding NarL/FixJ family response regulator n=1 Tax=Pseudarthrobacter enclensis TaxID=993070 RepID=A0ABT9RTG4_9MICC|nr:response regulator transcription factor [Pseudarthrobacter enclensis]MDP9888357.1 DNA-binding NarL/FixJ family response regulator [Pseudarthrobacter enclensis]
MDTPAAPLDEARSPAQPIRVFILNDHKMVRQGLGDLLEHHGFEIVGDSGSAAEAIHLIHVLQPDIAVLDDRLPDGTGIEVCRELRSAAPDVKCLILTSWDEQHAVRAAVLAGASGYVIKRVGDHNELLNCIRSAAAGIPTIGAGVRERVAGNLHATASAPWLRSMTPTERTVLALMARGMTNHQIGQELLLTDAAIAACVSSVLQNLGFRRRGQLLPAPIPRAWELLH